MKARALALITLVGIVATACQGGSQAGTAALRNAQIVIASDLPVGAYVRDVLPLQHAIQLAVDQQGTIAGFTLGYQPFDDSLAATAQEMKGIQNVKQMRDDSRVLGMIGPYTSNVVPAEIRLSSAVPLAMLSPSNTNVCNTISAPYCDPQPATLRAAGTSNNYFRLAPPDFVQGRAMARFAFSHLQVKRVAAFNEWDNPAEGDLIVDSFKRELEKLGGVLVLWQERALGTPRDFTDFLRKAEAMGADAVYAVSAGDNICGIRPQMKTLLPGAAFLATDGIGVNDPACIDDAKGNADGTVATFSDVDPTHSKDLATQGVVNAYLRAYPNTTDIPIYTFAAYDCARILIEAIKRAIQAGNGTLPSRAQVVSEIARGQFPGGVTGTYSFDANGDAVAPLMSIYKIENGHWVYGQQIDAGP